MTRNTYRHLSGNRRPPRPFLATWSLAMLFMVCLGLNSLIARESPALAAKKLLMAASGPQRYVPVKSDELTAIEQRFVRSMESGETLPEILTHEWQLAGWQVKSLTTGTTNEPLIVVSELPDQRRGGGFYLWKPRSNSKLVLQMPHSFSDQRTRELGLQLFGEGDFVAACWNTVPRKIVDVAHDVDHPFSAFTRALATHDRELVFVQLHGFDPNARQSSDSRLADLIVSNGNEFPEPMVRKTSILMETALPFLQVRLFPTQIHELGATTNVQAELLRQLGSRRFIHLEMSGTMRQRLVNDAKLRRTFLENLVEGCNER